MSETTDKSKEIIAIKCLNLLFFNYTTVMLEDMLKIREFNHCWREYLHEKKQTYMQIWEIYLTKVSYKTQRALLEIAYQYYLAEAERGYSSALEMEVIMAAHVAKHDKLNSIK